MDRVLLPFIVLFLLINVLILGLFALPVRSTLRALDYGGTSYTYIELSDISTDAKRVFWQSLGGDLFFGKRPLELKAALPIIWQDAYRRRPGKRFNHAQSHLIYFLLAYGQPESGLDKLRTTLAIVKLTKFSSPDRTLEVYLNTLPIDQEVFGLAAGSARYFNKAPIDLTLQEAATLAALARYGKRYDPWRDAATLQILQQEIASSLP